MPAPPVRTVRSIVAMVPLLLVAAACASDPAAPPPAASAVTDPPTTTTTEPATTTTAAPKTVEDEVAAAWVQSIDDFYAASADPAMADSILRRSRSGDSLGATSAAIASLEQAGRHVAYPSGRPEVSVAEVTAQDAAASLTGCVIDRSVVVEGSGEVVDDDITSTRYLAVMRLVDGTWFVVSEGTQRQWTDDEGCDR